MDLVVAGRPVACIVLPQNPLPTEAHAAAELQKYLEKISGATLPLLNDTVACPQNAVLLGGPARNRIAAEHISEAEFRRLVPGPDGMLLQSFGGHLLLAGSDDEGKARGRGTLYAVYEFLERCCGCAFVAYGAPGTGIGELVPQSDTLRWEEVLYCKRAADLPYRGAVVQFDAFEVNSLPRHALTPSPLNWMAKNRLNRAMLMLTSYEDIKASGMLEKFVERGISLTVGHHDSGMFFLPPLGNGVFPERYYETHPEYYRMERDGSRYCPESKWRGQLIFDLRSSAAAKALAANVVQWIGQNPYVDIINLWPNDDVAEQCHCDECAPHSKTSNYAWFCSEVAQEVARHCPDVLVDMLVYQDLWRPPEGLRFSSNLLVDVATWGPNMIRRFGCKDGSGLLGSEVEATAKAWRRYGGKIVYYDYYMTNFGSNQVYCPMADEISVIYEDFVASGYCMGTATQMEPYNLWNYLFNFYMHGRKSYDVTLGFEEILLGFSRIFGAAAPVVRQYIRYVEDFSDGQAPNGNECAAWFARHVDRERVYGLFEKAYGLLEEGPEKDSLRLLRMAFRYSDLTTNQPGNPEAQYMANQFGSYWGELGQVGYGIATYEKPGGHTGFVPDKWYQFSGEKA